MNSEITLRDRKPRVAIITRSIDRSGSSGSGHHLREMIRHLIPQAQDLEITLAHYQHNEDPIYSLASELLLPLNPLRAASRLNSANFDVVHFSPLTIFAPINGLKARKSATIHSAEPIFLPEAYSWVKRVHSRYLIPHYARKLDALLTVSETSKAWFADNYRIDRETIRVTYNSCSPSYRVLDASEQRVESSIYIPGPYILHVSRFSERKNPWTMLKAFKALLDSAALSDLDSLSLVLAGKDWDTPVVKEHALRLGIDKRIITPGFVSEETVVRLLNGAVVFWFPSLSEGFGMPNIEAMRCGCPVITSAVFAIPEVVGSAAILLSDPMNDEQLARETRDLLLDPEKRNFLINAGLSWSARYSWEDSASTMANVFRGLVSL